MIAPQIFILADTLTLFQSEGHVMPTTLQLPPSPQFSDLPVVLIQITQGGEGEEANLETQTTLAGISI